MLRFDQKYSQKKNYYKNYFNLNEFSNFLQYCKSKKKKISIYR